MIMLRRISPEAARRSSSRYSVPRSRRAEPRTRPLPLILALALAIVLASSAAFAHPLWLTEEGLGVEKGVDGWQLRTVDGASARLGLERDSMPVHLEPIEGGWLVSGVRTVSGGTIDGSVEQRIELVLARTAEGGGPGDVEALPAPSTSGFVVAPTPLTDGRGRLRQLLYFEGPAPHATALRAVRWEEGGWSIPETVSERGPGTQTALATALLADGTHLAAWAAYDGEDDEILWSRTGPDGRWSTPRPVTANAVPDVTPTLHAVRAGGALLAWSGFDGRDYRVFTTRFTPGDAAGEGEWSGRASLGGPGSVAPYFARAAGASLVFQQTIPRRWLVWQLSADGVPERSAATEVRLAERAVLLGVGEDGAELAWPALVGGAFVGEAGPSTRVTEKAAGAAPVLDAVSLAWRSAETGSP